MRSVFSALMAYIVSRFYSHESLRLENMALHHQLAVYQQSVKRPKLRPSDRLFWSWLSRLWPDWQRALEFVQPPDRDCLAEETVPELLATTEPQRQDGPSGHFERSPGPHPRQVASQPNVGLTAHCERAAEAG
jgi:hypothetical protein